MAQFAGALRKRALTWYMTFSERQPQATKAEIKVQFLSFFKTPDAKHLAAKKLKTTSQKPGDTVHDYDKCWKDLLSQLDYVIDEQLLIPVVSCSFISENPTTYNPGDIQDLRRCAYKSSPSGNG